MTKKLHFRRVISILLTIAMLLSNLSVNVFAASPPEIDGVPVIEGMGEDFTLQVPNLAYDEKSIILVWSKPDDYSDVEYFNVYQNGVLIGNTNFEEFDDSDSRAIKNISAFYDNETYANFHTKILVHNFTVNGLEPDTEYSFYVKSVDSNGDEIGESNTITQKTTAIPEIFNIAEYGAVEGISEVNAAENTKAIQAAIDACSKNGKVVVPEGTWVTGAIWLKSDLTFEIQKGGTLLASTSQALYPTNFWVYDYSTDERSYSLINAHTYDYGSIQNIRLVGEGVIDGNGWAKASGNNKTDLVGNPLTGYFAGSNSKVSGSGQGVLAKSQFDFGKTLGMNDAQAYAIRSNLLTFRGVDGIFVEGLTAKNPANHGFVNLHCKNIVYTNVINDTFDTNNGDGFEFGDSQNIMVFNNFNHSGDDAVNFASGMGQAAAEKEPTGNAWIFNNYIQEGHGGVVIGSHTGGWIQNILAEDNVLNTTDVGLRCKTNTPMGGGGRYILFRDNALENIDSGGDSAAFLFTSSYTDSNATIAYEPAKDISTFNNITVQNCTVRYTGTAKNPVLITGNGDVTEVYHNKILFDNVKLHVSTNRPASITYAKDITFNDFQLTGITPAAFWKITDSQGIKATGSTVIGGDLTTAVTEPTWPDEAEITAEIAQLDHSVNIHLEWPEASGVTKYILFVNDVDLGSKNITSTNTSTLIKELSPAADYEIKVYGQNATGERTSEPLVYTVYGLPEADEIAPAVPSSLVISGDNQPGYTWQTIKWNAASDDFGVTAYILNVNGEDRTIPVERIKVSSGTCSYVLGDLEMSTEYTISVRAVDAAGNESESWGNYIFNTRDAYSHGTPYWNSSALTVTFSPDEAEGNIGTVSLSWPEAEVESAQTVMGYRVYVNGNAITNNNDTFSPVNDTYTTNDTAYTIENINFSEVESIEVYPGSVSSRLSIRGTNYIPVPFYVWGGSPLTFVHEPEIGQVWKTRVFGQSTDVFFNSSSIPISELMTRPEYARFNTVLNESGTIERIDNNYVRDLSGNTVEDGELKTEFQMESRGGKITTAHDGITFYYTELDTNKNFVLEADVKVKQIGVIGAQTAKPEEQNIPSGQEGIGLMVRDIIGDPRKDPRESGFEELPSSSNFVAARFSGDKNKKYTFNLFERNGITKNGAANAKTNNKTFIPDYSLDITYKVTLERTDTDFIVTYANADGSNAKIQHSANGADIIQRIEPDIMYVGFFAARNVWAEFSNVSLKVTDAHTEKTPPYDPPKANASISVYSSSDSATDEYTYVAKMNYDGAVTLKQGDTTVVTNQPVEAYTYFTCPVELTSDMTNFTLSYTPGSEAPSQSLVNNTMTVKRDKSIISNPLEIYVSNTGSTNDPGTKEQPTNLDTAIKYLAPGGTIYVRGGEYNTPMTIAGSASGFDGSVKTIMPYLDEEVTFKGAGISVNGNYWHIKGFEVDAAAIRVTGSNNVFESIVVHGNNDTGFQIGNGSGSDPKGWPENNLVLNCESYNNKDESLTNADGFAAKLGVGVGNVFRGCISHHNIDDGWDLYNKIENGPNMPVTIENCIAYNNGITIEGAKSGAGNGFKLGGEGMPVNHVVKNCIAFNNYMDGFTCNFNPGQITLINNTSFNNVRHNYIFRTNQYYNPDNQGVFINNVSMRSDNGNTTADYISGNYDETSLFYNLGGNGSSGADINDFISIEAPEKFDRDADNNIIYGDFLRIKDVSILAVSGKGGEYAGYIGALATYKAVALSTLYSVINEALEEVLQTSIYTPASLSSLKAAVESAKAIAEKQDATLIEINAEIDNLQEVISALVTQISEALSVLNTLVDDAAEKVLQTSIYTPASINSLKAALESAKAIAEKEDVTLVEINDENDKLQEAISALVTQISEALATLNPLVNEAAKKVLQTSIYTPASINSLKAALESAKAIAEKEDVTLVEINDEIIKLQNAMSALVAKTIAKTPSHSATTETIKTSPSSYPSSVGDASGWKKEVSGWRLANGGSGYAKNEWKSVNNVWYFFNENGYMATGWVLLNNQWFYLRDSGAMATGWLLDNNKWYFLNSNGVMATGWILSDGIWYYLNTSGDMTTQPVLYQGKEYQFNQSGACVNP